MSVEFPRESPKYRAARERLLQREIELRRVMEAVAEARRALPPGGVVPEDYVFQGSGADGAPTDVRLSELFARGKGSLLIYSFMFPAMPATNARDRPAGARRSARRGGSVPVLRGDDRPARRRRRARHPEDQPGHRRQSPGGPLLTFAEERGWRHVRLLSSGGNTYNRDYRAETEAGFADPILNVFHRDGETIRHFWASELMFAPSDPGQHPRHVGTLEPVWNLFDLTREGRPEWDEQLSY